MSGKPVATTSDVPLIAVPKEEKSEKPKGRKLEELGRNPKAEPGLYNLCTRVSNRNKALDLPLKYKDFSYRRIAETSCVRWWAYQT